VPFFVMNFRIICRSPLVWWKPLSSCRFNGGFHPFLKCLKGFTRPLPDAAARIANDECGGAGIKRA
jgi:hypothetical protein